MRNSNSFAFAPRALCIACLSIVLSGAPIFAATHSVSPSGDLVQIVDGGALGVAPGDTIEIEAGNYQHLQFVSVNGSADAPVTIINKNGQVICDTDESWSGLTVKNCRYVRVTGTGSAGYEYGFYVGSGRSGTHSVNVITGSSDIEIDHVEVFKAGFAGFNVKDEPTVSGTYNRGQFLMRNINLHHNFVHDTGGEGFYLGHTFYNGYDINGTLYYPHLISGLRVHSNHTLRTGAEGIQVGSVIDGLYMYDNLVEDPGIDPFANYQNNGIQIGMSKGMVIGNTIRNAAGNGIIVLSQGDNTIACNIIERPGAMGMFVDDRLATPESIATGGADVGPGFIIVNNTIIEPGQDETQSLSSRGGVRLYGGDVTDTNYVLNNLVIGGGSEAVAVSYLNSSVPRVEGGNVWSANFDGLDLTDPASGDYKPLSTSSLVNAGKGVQRFGIHRDVADHGRTSGSAVDVGAHEFFEANTTHAVNDSIEGTHIYPYRIFVPPSAGPDNELPLVVFLHGIGEKGTDNEKQVKSHIQPLIDTTQGSKYAAYLVAPQASGGWFNGDNIVSLVNSIIATNHIDADRIYVTGLSAGGQGTWVSLGAGTNVFAAGVPLSAVSSPGSAANIAAARVPVWAFHGNGDGTVGAGQTRDMINRLETGGSTPRYTERDGWGHCCWANIYSDKSDWTTAFTGGNSGVPPLIEDGLYAWLFHQRSGYRPEPPDEPEPPQGNHLAWGDSILIDFGGNSATASPDSLGRHWNNANASPTTAGNVLLSTVSTNGTQTSVSVQLVDPFTGSNTAGVDDLTRFPSTAQSDTWWVGSFDGHAAALSEEAVVRLGNLQSNSLYHVRMFASRAGADGSNGRLTRYEINGAFRELEATDNTSNTAMFESVESDSQGNMDLTVSVSPDGSGRFAYLGVLELTAVAGESGTFSRYLHEHGMRVQDANADSNTDNDMMPLALEFLVDGDPASPDRMGVWAEIEETVESNEAVTVVRIPVSSNVKHGTARLFGTSDFAGWDEIASYNFSSGSGTDAGVVLIDETTYLRCVDTDGRAHRFYRLQFGL